MIGLIRLILICVLVYACIKVLVWVARQWKSVRARSEARRTDKGNEVSDMVRDPVCGTYIAAREALTIRRGGRDIHFCSTECRDKYVSQLR